jgi:endonuclease YncB( thermonuclease family)
MLVRVVLILGIFITLLGLPRAAALEGPVVVTDGDSLEMNGTRIRLFGIDAPEAGQSCAKAGVQYDCGATATAALRRLTENQHVRCAAEGLDRYGRTLAVCRVGNVEVNAWMVRQGHALSFRRYSEAYVPDENDARMKRRGIWQGSFDAPWVWRKEGAALDSQLDSIRPSRCAIKGNIGHKGKRLYHMAGDRDYARTVVSPDKGERWFCSEAEAIAAGWERAKR